MFTGIVESKGRIKNIRKGNGGLIISVATPLDLSDDAIGDSISVNGVCLTATEITKDTFSTDVSGETLSRTTLGELKAGCEVNLERALKAGDRFGGHIVTGHIDGLGEITKMERRQESVYIEIFAGKEILKYVVEKGSIAIDGVSLTVNSAGDRFFALNIIPHTLRITTLGSRKKGDRVNIETDIIGKYVEKLLGGKNLTKGVDVGLLKEYGFA